MPEMLTPVEVAEIMKISYESALAFIRYSGMDYVKVGRQYRVSRHKLDAFLSKKESPSLLWTNTSKYSFQIIPT